MDNINSPSKVKISVSALIFMGASILGALASIIDYVGLLTGSDIITFSIRSAWFIWFSPLCMYISLLLFKSILSKKNIALINKKKVNSSNKLGGLFTFMVVIGFVFTLVFSFYVEFKLKSENYFLCDKTSWMETNKYVKNISLCK
ncbi:DUF1240 domain-containing protein [Xenorhabdus innexi]|uniref:Membrane protein n=1 Tax=Xenorhabdus innexi TaxID=290109 RepID=A0A1N6MWL2_9GAMM|nr:DUF1240 domain-containing protein [Xenorhabdus innexi]PHM35904.1 membrane protein [Xenorhabdus innexi]SIP73202.1 conserved membrane hypothetical protein [Xenorhabdus innexi]